MLHTTTTKSVAIARVLLWLALAIAIFALSGCTSCRNNQVKPPNTNSQPDRRGERKLPERCHTKAPSLARRQEIEEILRKRRETTPMERSAGTVEIQVYFHVLTMDEGSVGNVLEAVLIEQITVLNKAFAGAGPDGQGAITPFKFVYAGMEVTRNTSWFNMTYNNPPTQEERDAKAYLNRGDKSTLNVYTASVAGGPFGWTRWPWDLDDRVDGIVIRHTTLPGGDSISFNKGDTLTHEVGHWLGLYHTFEGGCDEPGDFVDDTWPEEDPGEDCTPKFTCEDGRPDPIHNFMNYTTDECMYKFTRKQSDRMDTIHLEYRTP